MVDVGTWQVSPVEHHPEAQRGALTVVELAQLPFGPLRIFWLTGLQPGMTRGGHAHQRQSQVFVVLHGSVVFSLYDQRERHEVVRLARPDEMLVLGPLVWSTMMEFAPDTVVLALADGPYDEQDYLRGWEAFREYRAPEPSPEPDPLIGLDFPPPPLPTLDAPAAVPRRPRGTPHSDAVSNPP